MRHYWHDPKGDHSEIYRLDLEDEGRADEPMRGFLFAVPVALLMWAPIIWETARLL